MEKTGPRKQKDKEPGNISAEVWHVTVQMRGQGETTETREGERSRASMWVMRQVTLRVRGPNKLMEKQEGERSEGNLGMIMRQKNRGAEGRETMTGGQKEKSDWVTWKEEE
jgi:hypothetical protein